jgi:hypothetical protein
VRACLDVAARDRAFWTVFIEPWGESLHDPELAALNARTSTRARRLIAAGIGPGIGLSLQLTFGGGLMPLPRAVRLAEDALVRYLKPEEEG